MRCSFVPVLFLSLCWHQTPPRSPAANITLTQHILSLHICFFLKIPISLSTQSILLAVSKNATNNNRKAMVCYSEDEWYLPTVTTWMWWASRVSHFYIASDWLGRISAKVQIQLCRPHCRTKTFPWKMEVTTGCDFYSPHVCWRMPQNTVNLPGSTLGLFGSTHL